MATKADALNRIAKRIAQGGPVPSVELLKFYKLCRELNVDPQHIIAFAN